MATVTDFIRAHILGNLVFDPTPDLVELRRTEWCPEFARACAFPPEFEALMRSRLVLGGMRYGRFGYPGKGYPYRENMPGLLAKIRAFSKTGNHEFLVDIANYAMVLWRYPEPGMSPGVAVYIAMAAVRLFRARECRGTDGHAECSITSRSDEGPCT
jgi:hypothetical protein